jgi:hypothetical protein
MGATRGGAGLEWEDESLSYSPEASYNAAAYLETPSPQNNSMEQSSVWGLDIEHVPRRSKNISNGFWDEELSDSESEDEPRDQHVRDQPREPRFRQQQLSTA